MHAELFLEIELKRIGSLSVGLVIGTGLSASAAAQVQKDWQAPDIGKLPYDKFGQMVCQDKALMEETYRHLGSEVKQVSKRRRIQGAWPPMRSLRLLAWQLPTPT